MLRMAAHLSVRPGLPPWWLDEADGLDDGGSAPQLDGDASVDVCIVGGGFTGLWTALALRAREPAARVVVLEAERCGAGPSGRNGGFLHGYWASVAETRGMFGDDGARRARARGRGASSRRFALLATTSGCARAGC